MRKLLPRFSLVTAIVLMFAAGGLTWLNVKNCEFPRPVNGTGIGGSMFAPIPGTRFENSMPIPPVYRGWPLMWYDSTPRLMQLSPGTYSPDQLKKLASQAASQAKRANVDYQYAALDFAIALAILAAVGTISELVVRRIYRTRSAPSTDANRT